MQRACALLRSAITSGRAFGQSITLDRAQRHRRRVVLTTDGGQQLLLDLPEATYLADGDALVLDDGGLVLVKAAPEDLLAIHAHDPLQLARIAWHLGNRHTPCEMTADALYIQPDHVLAEMVAGLGGHVHAVRRPFEPEGGAYGGNGPLVKGHGHAHGHSHAHSHAHHHGPGHAPREPHETR